MTRSERPPQPPEAPELPKDQASAADAEAKQARQAIYGAHVYVRDVARWARGQHDAMFPNPVRPDEPVTFVVLGKPNPGEDPAIRGHAYELHADASDTVKIVSTPWTGRVDDSGVDKRSTTLVSRFDPEIGEAIVSISEPNPNPEDLPYITVSSAAMSASVQPAFAGKARSFVFHAATDIESYVDGAYAQGSVPPADAYDAHGAQTAMQPRHSER